MSGSRLKQASEQEAPVLDVMFTETSQSFKRMHGRITVAYVS